MRVQARKTYRHTDIDRDSQTGTHSPVVCAPANANVGLVIVTGERERDCIHTQSNGQTSRIY